MAGWQEFTGLNRGYVLELYDRFRQDPSSVDAETRALFERWTPPADDEPAVAPGGLSVQKIVGAVNLAQSIRRYGHLSAQLDPLGSRPIGDPSLLPETHGVTEDDLRQLPASLISSPLCVGAAHMLDVIDAFRRIYCSTTGYDYAHVFVPEEREWLREAAECGRFRAAGGPDRPGGAAGPADRGRGVRALPAPDLPRQDPLLDRGPGHAGADPRRGDRRRRRGRHAAHAASAWRTAAG